MSMRSGGEKRIDTKQKKGTFERREGGKKGRLLISGLVSQRQQNLQGQQSASGLSA